MNLKHAILPAALAFTCVAETAILSTAARAQNAPPGAPRDVFTDGPPPGMGPGPRGFGGPMQQELKILQQFDKDKNGRLDVSERKPAREFLQNERANRGGDRRRFGPPGGRFGPGGEQEPAKPGPRLTPADAKGFPNAGLYEPLVLRTFFLEFESADWEKELTDFHGTDVEVPAKLIVDGKAYPDVGVHFRGMSSYMGVGEGHKRSLNVSLDIANKDQNIGGYKTLNLLNSHEDPSFMRSVLSYQIDRAYIPAPKANFARVVINGESWGVYVNVQQFDKVFAKEWFGTTKGARWKVRGSPGGQGSLAYLGEDLASYKRIYTIKTKDDPSSWADLIKLCKTLNETPAAQLEAALSPMLDIDGALKFMALDNALINSDGYWIRTSDYALFQDEKGRFHLIPQDSNETFSRPSGPGMGGMMGPGMMLVPQLLAEGDKNNDRSLTRDEFARVAEAWFEKLDDTKSGKLTQEQFVANFGQLLPFGQGFRNGPGGPPGGGRAFGPGRFIAPGLFTAADENKDGALTAGELKQTFEKWHAQWDSAKTGTLDEEKLRTGLASVLPPAGPGGPGGGGRRGGGPRGPQVKGVELDPLYGADDDGKPLISKLLAVPALRERYLGYVRDIAMTWLDWQKLGPIARQYKDLIADEVKSDTRKLESTEAFLKSIDQDAPTNGVGPFTGKISLKTFAEQRRKYLLEKTEPKTTAK